MRRKIPVVSSLLLTLFIISISSKAVVSQQKFEWKVKVGYSKMYEYTKYFDETDNDGDGDQYSATFIVRNENGNSAKVVWEEGTVVTIEITQLDDNDDDAATKKTYHGGITTEEDRGRGWVRKTVDNKTYWEEYAEEISLMWNGTDSLGGVGANVVHPDIEAYVEGHLLVIEQSHEVIDLNGRPLNITRESIEIRDWKTGWLIYSSAKTFNNTHTKFEMEYSEIGYLEKDCSRSYSTSSTQSTTPLTILQLSGLFTILFFVAILMIVIRKHQVN